MKATMKQIAESCGVSKSLVSRILNNDNTLRVTNKTRERVLQEVEKQGYSRDINAQALANLRNHPAGAQYRLGYITFSSLKYPGHPYFSHIVEGITDEMSRRGCELGLSLSISEFQRSLDRLQTERLDGIILLGQVEDPRLHRAIKQMARYVVSMDGTFDKNSDYVGTDTSQSLCLALDHMLNLGYTDIGMIGSSHHEARMRACEQRMRDRGLSFNPNWLIDGGYGVDISYERVGERLETHKPPRALVAWNDEMAISAIKALKEHGYRVPEDVAVTGHDDILLAAYVDTPLTTVHIYKKEMGRLAVKILLDRIETQRKNTVLLEIPGKLIKRDSCGFKLAGRKPPAQS